jgi:hypothetical protein
MSLDPPMSDSELLRIAQDRAYHADQRANAARNAVEPFMPKTLGPDSCLLQGRKGGFARAAKLSPERRSQIARDAALARWKPPRAKPKQKEFALQCEVVAWCKHEGALLHLELARVISIPNSGGYSGGYKANVVRVARAKASGVAVGFPDLFLPVPRGIYHGAMLELKREGERPSAEQLAWLDYLVQRGYCADWVDAFDDARFFFCDYMRLDPFVR